MCMKGGGGSGVVNNEKWEGVGGWAGLAGHTLVMEYDL